MATQTQSYVEAIPEENKYKLDRTVDFDHSGVPKDLGEISRSMDQWEGIVADKLELTKAEVAAIKTQYPGQLNLQARAALQKWQEKAGLEATYRNLITVFVNAGKGGFAEAVCRVLGAKFEDFQLRFQNLAIIEDDPPLDNLGYYYGSLPCADPQSLQSSRPLQDTTTSPSGHEHSLYPTMVYTSSNQRRSCEPLSQSQSTRSYYQQAGSFQPIKPQTQHPRLAQHHSFSPHPHQLVNFPQMIEPYTQLSPFYPTSQMQFRPLNPSQSTQRSFVLDHGSTIQTNQQPHSRHSDQTLCSPPQPPYLHPGMNTLLPHYQPELHLPYVHPHQPIYRLQHQSVPFSYMYQPPPLLPAYADYLKGVYKSASVCSDKFPQISSGKFISLALVKKERISRSEAGKFTKATLHGHIDEILKKKEPIKMEEILKPTKDQDYVKCIFVEGAPGIGKSTFCWEFCRRWDEIESLKKFKLVYLLRLREKRVQEVLSLKDLFYHDDDDLRNGVTREIMQCEGRGVLLVLDGFDELPVSLRHSSLFVRLIHGSCLPYSTILVTSRPSATADLFFVAKPQISKQVELLGFTQECIEEYARSVFSSQTDSMLADFLKYVSINPAIRSMMYIPLNSAIVVEVYKENKTSGTPIPQTMTQLYSELSNVLLRRHLIGKGDTQDEDLPDSLLSSQNELYKPLSALAKLAFDGILLTKVIFDKLPDGCDHFGFMNASSELYLGRMGKVSYSFLHLTLQEFFAALHISQHTDDEQTLLFERYRMQSHYDIVWRFVAGLTGFKQIKCAWKTFEDVQVRVHPFYIRCFYEAHCQEMVDSKSVFPESKILNYRSFSSMQLFDYYALGYCVSVSNCKWMLTFMDQLGDSELNGEMFEFFSYCLQGKGNKNITSLTIVMDLYESSSFIVKLVELIHIVDQLQEFDFTFSECTKRGHIVENLLTALSKLRYLRTLKIHLEPGGYGTTIIYNFPMRHTLSSSLQQLKCLNRLELYFLFDMPFECLQVLSEAIFSSPSLTEVIIDVQWNNWEWSSGVTPFTLLEDNRNIKRLTLCQDSVIHSNFPRVLVVALSQVIEVNYTLEYLTIRDNKVLIDDIITLNEALEHNSTLKQLQLRLDGLAKLNELDQRIMIKSA